MKNKLLSVIAAASLAMTSFASLAVTASAADSDYTIAIPSTLSVANPGWNSIGNIEASGTLSENKKLILSASSENDWALKSDSNSVSYTMKETAEGSEKTSWEFTSLPATQAIGIDVEDYSTKPVGTYTDTVTFTASVEDAPLNTLNNGDVIKINGYYQNATHSFSGQGTYNDGRITDVSTSSGNSAVSLSLSYNDNKLTVSMQRATSNKTVTIDLSTGTYKQTISGNSTTANRITFTGLTINGVAVSLTAQ